MTRRLFLLTILLVTMAVAAAAQTKPIRWRLTVSMTSPTEGVATLRALVAEGWHLYGTTLPEGGPKATKITMTGSTDVRFTGQATASVKSKSVHDPVFNMDLTWWDTNVQFTLPFTVTGDNPVVKINVSYMGCNNETCLPPSSETLTFKIQK